MTNVTRIPVVNITPPKPFSLEAVRNPIHVSDMVVCCWCSESGFGGLYFPDLKNWQLTGPYEDLQGYLDHLKSVFPKVAKRLTEEKTQ